MTIVDPAWKPAIELHFPDREVDNPSIFTRTCLAPATHARIISGLENGYGYSVLLVARQESDTSGHHEVREVFDPLQAGKYLTFPRPGEWEVGIFLFERQNTVAGKNTTFLLERNVKDEFLELRPRKKRRSYEGRYKKNVRDFSHIEPHEDVWRSSLSVETHCGDGAAIAKYVVTLQIPPGIFAKPPSEFVRIFGNYFFRQPPYDQCEFRQRLLMMTFGLGFIPWLIVEFAKHVLCFIGGLISLLFMVKGSPKFLAYAFRRSANLSLGAAVADIEDPPEFIGIFGRGKYNWAFSPGVIICVCLVGFIVFEVVTKIIQLILAHLVLFMAITVICVLFGTAFLCAVLVRRFVRWTRNKKAAWRNAASHPALKSKESFWERRARARYERAVRRPLELGQQQAQLAKRQAAAFVCGDAPMQVSLEALPKEVVTFRMLFEATKVRVCRPFSY